jgi:dolichol-phosphate mannosyltransferase
VVIRLFTDRAVPGWSSVVIAVLILGGVQLVCLGVIGQYLGRVYDETKARPLYVVAEETAAEAAPLSGDA